MASGRRPPACTTRTAPTAPSKIHFRVHRRSLKTSIETSLDAARHGRAPHARPIFHGPCGALAAICGAHSIRDGQKGYRHEISQRRRKPSRSHFAHYAVEFAENRNGIRDWQAEPPDAWGCNSFPAAGTNGENALHQQCALRASSAEDVAYFTAAAVLTLALGIGGTTAIFTLVDAVMLRSLPVSDPGRLFRIGDGDDCCVDGGLQNQWGMFSYPLFLRLRAEAPEFEELAAFQAGGGRLSVRRAKTEKQGSLCARNTLRETTFPPSSVASFAGKDVFPRRTTIRARRSPQWCSVIMPGRRTAGSDPSVIGSSFFIEAQPFTVIGIAPPGFFRRDAAQRPRTSGFPCSRNPPSLPPAPCCGNLRRHGCEPLDVCGPGFHRGNGPEAHRRPAAVATERLGLSLNWMPDVIRGLPKQSINIV